MNFENAKILFARILSITFGVAKKMFHLHSLCCFHLCNCFILRLICLLALTLVCRPCSPRVTIWRPGWCLPNLVFTPPSVLTPSLMFWGLSMQDDHSFRTALTILRPPNPPSPVFVEDSRNEVSWAGWSVEILDAPLIPSTANSEAPEKKNIYKKHKRALLVGISIVWFDASSSYFK